MLNKKLLADTMNYILKHPEEHDQDVWYMHEECGTTACFAGWATILDIASDNTKCITPAGFVMNLGGER